EPSAQRASRRGPLSTCHHVWEALWLTLACATYAFVTPGTRRRPLLLPLLGMPTPATMALIACSAPALPNPSQPPIHPNPPAPALRKPARHRQTTPGRSVRPSTRRPSSVHHTMPRMSASLPVRPMHLLVCPMGG